MNSRLISPPARDCVESRDREIQHGGRRLHPRAVRRRRRL